MLVSRNTTDGRHHSKVAVHHTRYSPFMLRTHMCICDLLGMVGKQVATITGCWLNT